MTRFRIGDHWVGEGCEPFLIAEVSVNHNGSVERALEMIRVAANWGISCVKFQTFKADAVCPPDQMYTYPQGDGEVTERRVDMLRRCELPESAWPVLKAECEKHGALFMSTPQNPSDLDILLRVGVPAIKIGSDDLTCYPMLRYCSRDDIALPIILSCGMSDMAEVSMALQIVGAFRQRDAAILACTSQYPCPPEEANLGRITTLKQLGIPVGFSDHLIGDYAATVASALGACIFETHFTLDNSLPGPDHAFSKSPSELMRWAWAINHARTLMGSGEVKPSAKEIKQKQQFQRTGFLNAATLAEMEGRN